MRNRYTKEMLQGVVDRCANWAQVCRALNVVPMTGAQTHLKKRAIDFGVDFSHFTGKSWNKGRTFPPKKTIEEYLVYGFVKSHALKLRLIKEGIKEGCCEQCGLSEWGGEELPLDLDHIDGDHLNNVLENLMILCPNCHAVKTREQRSKK